MTKIVNLDESTKNSSASSIEIFENSEFGKLNAIIIDGEPWFVGKEVAHILGYSNPNEAVMYHVDDFDRKVLTYRAFSKILKAIWSGNDFSNKVIINESGLYSLIMGSNMDKAKEFKRWVTSEVLPSIRKHGSYSVRNNQPSISDKEYEVRMIEAKNRSAEILMSILDKTSIPEYKSVLQHYIVETITGDSESIPLPVATRKTYSAGEIGSMLGVSGNKIGRLANEHNLKTSEYGKLFYDKSKYSNKEVETFRYYENAISVFRELLSDNLSSKKNTLFG